MPNLLDKELQGASFGKQMAGSFKSGALNGAISGITSAIGQGISGGMSSGAGNVIGGLANVASAIPGPWGAAISGGLNLIGGGVNALFGSKINQEVVNESKASSQALSNTTFTGQSNADLLANSNFGMLGSLKKSDVGKEGLFSNKVTKLTNKLNAQRENANRTALNNFSLAVDNAAENSQLNAQRAYAAYGGPLEYNDNQTLLNNMFLSAKDQRLTSLPNSFIANNTPNPFAFGGSLQTQGGIWSNGLTTIDNGGSHEINPQQGVPMGIAPDGLPNLVEQNEAIYKDYVFSDRLTVPKEIKEKYKLKKDSTYADAAKKASKESEERPNDPISKRGLDASMRELMASQEEKKAIEKAKELQKAIAKMSPEQLAEIQQLGAQQQEAQMQEQAMQEQALLQQQQQQMPQQLSPEEAAYQELAAQGNGYAKGGRLFRFGSMLPLQNNLLTEPDVSVDDDEIGTKDGNGSVIKEEQLNKVDKTVTAPTWVAIYNQDGSKIIRTISSANNNYETVLKSYGLSKDKFKGKGKTRNVDVTLADGSTAKKDARYVRIPATKKYVYTDNEGKDVTIDDLTKLPTGLVAMGKGKFNPDDNTITTRYGVKSYSPQPTWMRFAPVAGSAVGLGLSMMPADYENSDRVQAAANLNLNYDRVGFNPIGNYLTYRPLDVNYQANLLRGQQAATRRAIYNNALGNRGTAMASILANNYANQIALADAYRKAEESNIAQKQAVETFNRGTNSANSEGMLKAAIANQDARGKALERYYAGTKDASQLRQIISDSWAKNLGTNIGTLFNNIGALGKENFNFNNLGFLIKNVFPTMSVTQLMELGFSEEDARSLSSEALENPDTKAKGGKLRKRKGLTY